MESKSNFKEPKPKGGQPGKIVSPRSKILNDFIESGGTFRTIKASELFEVKSNPQLDKDNFVFSEFSEYPYFTRTVSNNGILGYVDYLDSEHLISGNSIAVGMMGMMFFYQSHDFYAGQFTKTLFPKFDRFNEKIALWFIAWFNKHSNHLKGVLVRDFEKTFNEIEIEVPYKGDDIDFNFIELRMRELEELRMRELEAYLSEAGFDNCELTTSESNAVKVFLQKTYKGKFFEIASLYNKLKMKNLEFDKHKDTAPTPSEEFCIPLVNAKVGDNGIMYYGRPHIFSSEPLTIDVIQNGAIATGRVYAQPQPTGVLWDAYLLKAITHTDTENTLLFFACAIEKRIKPFFNRDLKATWDRIKSMSIYIPINDNGDVDFSLIEHYINAIKKVTISELNDYISKERQAYIVATNH